MALRVSSIGWRSLGALVVATILLPASVLAAPSGDPPEPPEGGVQRVVSLVPSVTETIFALGAQDRLVAVSTFCDHPPEVDGKPRAGTYLLPNVEQIVAFKPDVVIGVPTPGNQAAVEQLRSLGVNVVMVGEDKLADAWQAMRDIGAWVGRKQEAEALVKRVQGEVEDVRRKASGMPRQRVLFVVGHDPLVVAGSGLFIDELIELVGGRNVGREAQGAWPRLSLETVVASAPDVIIDGAMGTESDESLDTWWSDYRSVPAVRDGRVRSQRSDSLLRPGPRLGQAARELYELVHAREDATP